MAVNLKVTWVDKIDHPDTFQRINKIGGNSRTFQWKHSYAEAIESAERGLFNYYVEKNGHAVRLDVGMAPNGVKYLKTKTDAGLPEFLLELPDSPKPVQAAMRH